MKINFNITAFFLLIILISGCEGEKNNTIDPDNSIKVDTSFTFKEVEYNLKISGSLDTKNSFIQNGDYDASENDVIGDEDEYWLNHSNYFKIEIFDEKNKFGKSYCYINIDLIKGIVKNNQSINQNLGSLNGVLLADRIEFIGTTTKGIAMFKIFTFWGGGDGGGQEWVLGMELNTSGWADDYRGAKERHMPVCLIEVINQMGENFHFKNNKYILGDFIGDWNFDCSGFSSLSIDKKNKYISVPVTSNQIYLNARYELKDDKLLLFLNYESGFEFGDFGRGGGSYPWDDYSREKTIAELSLIGKNNDQVEINWLGFYNKKSETYEGEAPEFMNIVEGSVQSKILNRCK